MRRTAHEKEPGGGGHAEDESYGATAQAATPQVAPTGATTTSITKGDTGWRRLPTAWIHLLWVECFKIYISVLSWRSLLNHINVGTAFPGYSRTGDKLNTYFETLFFLGASESTTVNDLEVVDPFFLRNGQEAVSTCSTLTLPGTFVNPANLVWVFLAWSLPLAAIALMCYIFGTFISAGIWSFESIAYLRFTWGLYRASGFKWCVYMMCVGPILLPIVWGIQIIMFNLQDQWRVLTHSLLSIFLLLFSLDALAFPTTPVHQWPNADGRLHELRFRRPLLHLVLGTNGSFGLKLVDALWTAQNGDAGRLRRYLADPSQAESALELCCREQQAEAEKKR